MGFTSIWHWLVVLVIIVLVFGTSKLKNAGKDIGSAINEFKKGLNGDEVERSANNDTADTKSSEDKENNS